MKPDILYLIHIGELLNMNINKYFLIFTLMCIILVEVSEEGKGKGKRRRRRCRKKRCRRRRRNRAKGQGRGLGGGSSSTSTSSSTSSGPSEDEEALKFNPEFKLPEQYCECAKVKPDDYGKNTEWARKHQLRFKRSPIPDDRIVGGIDAKQPKDGFTSHTFCHYYIDFQ